MSVSEATAATAVVLILLSGVVAMYADNFTHQTNQAYRFTAWGLLAVGASMLIACFWMQVGQ